GAAEYGAGVTVAQPGGHLEVGQHLPGGPRVDVARRGQGGRGQPHPVNVRPGASEHRALAQLSLGQQAQVRLAAARAHPVATQSSGTVTVAWLAGPTRKMSSDRALGCTGGMNRRSTSTWLAP